MNNPYGPPGGGPYGPPPQQQGYPPQQGYPQQGGYPMPPYMQSVGQAAIPSPERTRRTVGLILFLVSIIVGMILNVFFYLYEVFNSKNPGRMAEAILTGAIFATLPLIVYLFVPAIIDRYDPEPWWCLAMAFLWGALVATGFAGLINTVMHQLLNEFIGTSLGNVVTVSVIAPLCEEFLKGLAVLGAFYFLRREFDGVVDGIIYATFAAIGFACVENINYYARADIKQMLGTTFVLRGMVAPWGHPLYTSMIGIGFGLARESDNAVIRVIAPFAGYIAGVTLHAIWNFVPTVFGGAFLFLIPFWLLFVGAFFFMICLLVYRKGKTIRTFLKDEVLLGNLSQDEVELICSPVGRLKCTMSWRGKPGRDFIGAGARLALSKWHTARAMRGSKRTVSADFIVPMRNEIKRLRNELLAKMPRSA